MAREIDYIDPHDLIIIGLDTEDRAEHPLYDERIFLEVEEALVRNILVYGIQQPVIVRKEAGRTLVVDGRQRVRAARLAKQRQGEAGEIEMKVPTRSSEGTDNRIVGIMISTNEQRKDDTVLTKAAKAVRMLDQVGDINEVAIAFGRTVTTIRNWIILSKADPALHAAVEAGQVSASAAIQLAKYPREQQAAVLEDMLRQIEVSGARAVSEAQAKAQLQEDGLSDSDPNKANASARGGSQDALGPIGTGEIDTSQSKPKARQLGVKRAWLRKALQTQAANDLDDDQRGVLEWIATGASDKGTWWDDFQWAAESEMEDQ